jgi:hypothetical protein
MNLSNVVQNGSLWLLLACGLLFVGVVIGTFTKRGSGISSHPYTKSDGGELASDLPPELLGDADVEPGVWTPPAPAPPESPDRMSSRPSLGSAVKARADAARRVLVRRLRHAKS